MEKIEIFDVLQRQLKSANINQSADDKNADRQIADL